MSTESSKNKTLLFIIFLLLLTNIAVIGYFGFFCKSKDKHKGRESFSTILQKEVGFDQQQVDKFNELKKSHWEQAKLKMDEIIKIKNSIYDLTKKPNTPDSVVERLADSIGRLQKQVEISAYKHVSGTRKICTPQQLPAYDSLMKRIINHGRNSKSGGNKSKTNTDKK